MNQLNVFKSTTRTPIARVSSGLNPISTITGLSAAAEELVTTAVTSSTAKVSLDRVAQPHSLNTGSRRSLWARVQPALSVSGLVATRQPSRPPHGVAADADNVANIVTDTADVAKVVDAGDLVNAAPPAASPKPPSAISRVELTIDSLRNYELIRPIPVVVESLGERNYVAEMPELNISTTASNPSDILITLKDRIAQVYDGLRIKKNLDTEQARQLRLLETYIGRSRRGWLDRL
jgi:hypothetical protein